MQRRSAEGERVNTRVWVRVASGVAVLATTGFFFLQTSGDSPSASNAPTVESSAPSSSTTTTTTTTTSEPLRLPQPADAPTDPREAVPVVQIGEVEIPKIGLRHKIYEGIWLTVIDVGPGHWPGSAEPGGYGNTVIAGHRVTHSHPFRRIDELVEGDEIIVRTPTGVFTYAMVEQSVVSPEDTWIVNQTPGYALTLFACHPPGSAKYRYVVRAELRKSEPPVPIEGMA